jgi:hypothetical protein
LKNEVLCNSSVDTRYLLSFSLSEAEGKDDARSFEEWLLSCHVVGILENMLLTVGTMLRVLDWILYLPSCLVWALMLCPRDQPQVYKEISVFDLIRLMINIPLLTHQSYGETLEY